MTILDLEVLQASVVLVGLQLLHDDATQSEFRRSLGAEVIPAPGAGPAMRQGLSLDIGFGPGVEASFTEPRSFAIGRDRITFNVAPSGSAVVQEYPRPGDIGRLAEVIGLALQITGRVPDQPYAVGYNIHLVYEQDAAMTASAYLAHRMFRGLDAIDDWPIVGGDGTLSFSAEDGGAFNLTVEPRFREEGTPRVFIAANLHRFEVGPLGAAEIEGHLNDSLDKARRFVELLDREESQ